MTSWKDFATAEPELAARVQQHFESRKHMTLATVRRDGSPRISGTEVAFRDGELTFGMDPASLKAHDLARDARVAVHGPSIDPPDEHPSHWPGEAKIAGTAIKMGDSEYRVDLTEVVFTKVADTEDALVIDGWHPGRGRQSWRR